MLPAHASCHAYRQAAPAVGDQLLQQALMEEAAKAAKNGLVADPYSGVQFKEVCLQLQDFPSGILLSVSSDPRQSLQSLLVELSYVYRA